jgi:Na+-translocating ferredoxin:NAD+ oxidoreductase RnfC subunit
MTMTDTIAHPALTEAKAAGARRCPLCEARDQQRAAERQEAARQRAERQQAARQEHAERREAARQANAERQHAATQQRRQTRAERTDARRVAASQLAAERRARRVARPPLSWPGWGNLAATAATLTGLILAGVAGSNTHSPLAAVAALLVLIAVGVAAVCVPVALWRKFQARKRARAGQPES